MIGKQIPRIRIEPNRVATDGSGAAMLMEAYGVKLDEFQRLVIDCWLGKDANGNYTCTSAGLSLSRQNGKNVCLECLEFYGLVVNGWRIIHTAHQTRTSRHSFRRLVGMFTDKSHPEITALVKQIRYGAGEESIELKNGGVIQFCARTRQAARGFDGISLVVFDEAQDLGDEQLEAIMATLSASASGQRMIIYSGTPPYASCVGTVFRRFRESCLELEELHKNKCNAWHEWSIEVNGSIDDININDRELWYRCNPAMGVRLTEDFTEEEAHTLSKLGFLQERLGVWLQPSKERIDLAIHSDIWEACRSEDKKPEGKTAFGVKFSADGSMVVLAGCTLPIGGKGRISIIECQPLGNGLQWLATWLNERAKIGCCVVIDGRQGSDVLIDKIKDTWRIKNSIIKPKSQDVCTAASMLVNDLVEQNITWYAGQEALKESALHATKRSIGSGWGFGGDGCELIEACSLALWGCKTTKRNPQKQMKIG